MPISAKDMFEASKLAPEKAIEFLKSKGVEITWDWKEALTLIEKQAFTVAKAMKLDILDTIYSSLTRALEKGQSFEDFLAELEPKLKAGGWWGYEDIKNPNTGAIEKVLTGTPWRLQVIYRTNMQSSYMQGRYRAMKEVVKRFPYWQNISVVDKQTTSACQRLHLTIFRADSPFWTTGYPPGHFACRRRVVTVSERVFKRDGLEVADESHFEDFKNSEGFDRSPESLWKPDLTKYPKALAKIAKPDFVD